MKLKGKKLFVGILATAILSSLSCISAFAEQVAVYHIDPTTGLLDPNYVIEERDDSNLVSTHADDIFTFAQTLTTSFSPLKHSGSSIFTLKPVDNKIIITLNQYTSGRPYYFKIKDNTRNKELVDIDNFTFSLPKSEIKLANYGGNYTVRMRVGQGTANVSGTITSEKVN